MPIEIEDRRYHKLSGRTKEQAHILRSKETDELRAQIPSCKMFAPEYGV